MSKKLTAFLTTLAVLTSALVVSLILHPLTAVSVVFNCLVVVTIGCLALGYITSQKALDSYLGYLKGVKYVE